MLPGLLLYGIGLSLVLSTNDPVSLDTIPPADEGQASGVSATAEQGGGAVGIAVLYALFHTTYVSRLEHLVDTSPLRDLSPERAAALRTGLQQAEQTGLHISHFNQSLDQYLFPARAASERGYAFAFLAMSGIAAIGFVVVALLVGKPPEPVGLPVTEE